MANGVSILIRSWSPNRYLPRMSPTRTTPFPENSQTVASEPPDMRHLPVILGFPHAVPGLEKKATLERLGSFRDNRDPHNAESLTTRFDLIKRSLPRRGVTAERLGPPLTTSLSVLVWILPWSLSRPWLVSLPSLIRSGGTLPVRQRRKLFPSRPCLRRDEACRRTLLLCAVALQNSLPL